VVEVELDPRILMDALVVLEAVAEAGPDQAAQVFLAKVSLED
jgi:hypothetical protein